MKELGDGRGRQWEEEGNEPPNIFDKFTPMPLQGHQLIHERIIVPVYAKERWYWDDADANADNYDDGGGGISGDKTIILISKVTMVMKWEEMIITAWKELWQQR